MSKQNWFPTLNDALISEFLLHTWDPINPSIPYNHTYKYDFEDIDGKIKHISIYRNENGLYERPIHYYL